MRIAIFSECYTPVTNGVVTSIVTLRDALRALGHTVYVFAPGTPQPDDDADVFRLPELPFPRHPYHFARPFPRLPLDFAALDVDIIHCQHPFTIGRMGADLARKYDLPMVYTAHSLYDMMIACAKSPLVRKMGPQAVRGFMRRFCARAQYVIAPTRHTRDALRADGVRARFAVVPSGVQPPIIRPEAREETRRRLNLAPETPLLLYVGRLGPEKRLDLLLEAAQLLTAADLPGTTADFRLALVGDGQCREDLESQTLELGLQDRVVFVGAQAHATIGDWYAAGDLFVLPSPAETQGLVLVEAMACGLPCIAVDQGGPRELITQGETGIRVTPDAASLARAVDFLLRSPEVCQRFWEQGRERAAEFSPEAMARSMLSLYESARILPLPEAEKGVQKFTSEIRKRRDRIKRVRSRALSRRKMT